MKRFLDFGAQDIALILTIVFSAGMAYAIIKSIPGIQDQVSKHETRIAVLEAKLDDIKSDTVELLKRVSQ